MFRTKIPKFLLGLVFLAVFTVPAIAFSGDTLRSDGESKYKIVIRTTEDSSVPPEKSGSKSDDRQINRKDLSSTDSRYSIGHGAPLAVEFTEPKISMSAYNKRLGDILLEIGANTGYTVIFGPQVDPNVMVIADFKDMPLSRAVSAVTAFVNYSYEINKAEKIIKAVKSVTRIFSVPDVAISSPVMSAEMGGDMVGSGSEGASGGSQMFPGAGGGIGSQNLKANVTLKKADDKIDGRKSFEDNIRKLLSPDGHYIIDWLSATLMVTDSVANVDLIGKYIGNIKEVTGKQLAVYATITQISTTKDFRYGIDWDLLVKRVSGEVLTGAGRELKLKTSVSDIASPTLTITRTAADVTAVLKALEEQGNVQVLANPYLYVRNLQPVAIFSGKSVPYIGSIQKSVAGTVGESTTSFSIARAQDGIMLAVRCYVKDNGDIDVQIAPVLTSIDEFVTFNIEGNTFTNPVSSVQQTMQSVTIKDGETVIIGGVKREKREISEKGVPFLSKVPILGALFKSETNTDNNSELVIALKVKRVETK